MALVKCPECSAQVSDKAVGCPACGYPIASQAAGGPSSPAQAPSTPTYAAPATVAVSKSRGTYIILGLLFGGLGFHNFYSGHHLRGAIKVGVLLVAFVLDASTRFFSAFSVIALVLFALWSLVEIIFIKQDAGGSALL